ncbi:MAG: hypothetical protein QM640_17250 [Niabella sp.]
MENQKNKKAGNNVDAPVKPDPETLGKTDPQEDMKGPVSSITHKGGKLMETKESKEDATRRHDRNM